MKVLGCNSLNGHKMGDSAPRKSLSPISRLVGLFSAYLHVLIPGLSLSPHSTSHSLSLGRWNASPFIRWDLFRKPSTPGIGIILYYMHLIVLCSLILKSRTPYL
jgi:hypothetical protein